MIFKKWGDVRRFVQSLMGVSATVACMQVGAFEAPAPLVLTHTVINNGSADVSASDTAVYINDVQSEWDVAQLLAAGPYRLVITPLIGYKSSQWKGDCNIDGSIDLTSGQEASCEIVSNDFDVDLVLNKR